ncbi:MAG: hypothetical protein NVS2B16_11150 [Chloroflexota bacterium]
MTFVRGIFLFALVMLVVGMVGSRIMLQNIFGSAAHPAVTRPVANRATPSRVVAARRHTARAGIASARSHATSGLRPHHHMTLSQAHARPRARAHIPAARAVALVQTPIPTPIPLPTPTIGPVSIARYWVNQTAARHGNTVALGYVINNPTGHTIRMMLGASVKSTRAMSWAAQSLSDPAHDVVAIVPPGISTHTRFFTLPSRLHPGAYDVAWGLRNATSGRRDGLVAAPSALRVTR